MTTSYTTLVQLVLHSGFFAPRTNVLLRVRMDPEPHARQDPQHCGNVLVEILCELVLAAILRSRLPSKSFWPSLTKLKFTYGRAPLSPDTSECTPFNHVIRPFTDWSSPAPAPNFMVAGMRGLMCAPALRCHGYLQTGS